jgi:flagellar assembly protein FliH
MSSSSSYVHAFEPVSADALTQLPAPEEQLIQPDDEFGSLPMPELRTGTWTRLGDRSLLGDPVTETFLAQVAERARAAAEAQGYTVGWAKGKADAEAEIMRSASLRIQDMESAFDEEEEYRVEEHKQAIEALANAAEQVRAQVATLIERVETQTTELAWALVEMIFDRELTIAGGSDVIRRVMQVMPSTPLVAVRLHPEVIADADLSELYDRGVEIIPDDTLQPSEAMVSSDGSVIELRLHTALERVREALMS